MNATVEFILGVAAGKAASEGKKLRNKDANATGKDDLLGQGCIIGAAVIDAIIDDELSMNATLAKQLRDFADMIENPANKKE